MKKIVLLLPVFLFLNQHLLSAQNFEWVKEFGGGDSDIGMALTADETGNVYSTGFFKSTTDFDPGVGVQNLSSIGTSDIFISKLDLNGNYVWAKQIGSSGANSDVGRAITLDNTGNIYTTGDFALNVDFDPGPGVFKLNSNGPNAAFISKLDNDGNFVWAKMFGGSGDVIGNALTLDDDNNIYSTGSFEGSADFDPGNGTATLTSAGDIDVYISKLDANGDYVWANRIGGSEEVKSNKIVVDQAGNVYVVGYFYGTVDFDPSASTFNLNSRGEKDGFVCKFDNDGNFVWVKRFESVFSLEVNDLVVDQFNSIYLTGYFRGTVDFDPANNTFHLSAVHMNDAFICKLNFLGSFEWAKKLGGNLSENSHTIFLDRFGDIYTTGTFEGNGDFDPGPEEHYINPISDTDTYISRLDAGGNFISVQQMGASNISSYLDNGGNHYIIGNFYETVDFDIGTQEFNLTPTNNDAIYLHKTSQIGTTCTGYPLGGIHLDTAPVERKVVTDGRYLAWARDLGADQTERYDIALLDTEDPNQIIQSIQLNDQLTPSFGTNISIADGILTWEEGQQNNTKIWYYDLTTQTINLVSNSSSGSGFVNTREGIIVWRTLDDIRYFDTQNPLVEGTVIISYAAVQEYPIGTLVTNGRYIVWQKATAGSTNTTLHRYDLQNTGAGVINITTAYRIILNLNMQDDLIVWSVNLASNLDIHYYDFQNAGAGFQILTNNNLIDGQPHTDGRYIVWTRVSDGSSSHTDVILYDTQNPGETIIATQDGAGEAKIQNNFIIWKGGNNEEESGIAIYDLNNPNNGISFLSHPTSTDDFVLVDDLLCWTSDNDVYYYEINPIEDADADGFCAFEDCDDTNANIYPFAPCNDNNDCTTNSFYDENCNCVSSELNDRCATAVKININSVLEACNSGTSDYGLIPSCFSENYQGGDTWFSFTLGDVTSADVQIGINSSVFDHTNIELFSGSCGQLTTISCGDGGTSPAEIINVLELPPNATYYFRVWDNDNDDMGNFEVYINAQYESCPSTFTYNKLRAFYNSVNGTNWTNQTGWDVPNACDPCNYNGAPWYGVTCENNEVIEIVLSNNNLIGQLPGDIGQLSSLKVLNLENNSISGSIPTELDNLCNLKNLNLSNNNLDGTIPTPLGNLANLEVLWLNNNLLTGNIPSEFGNLSKLESLVLSTNQLDGTIPVELGNILGLETLILFANNLIGDLLPGLGLLPLTQIRLDQNNFTGCFPASYNSFCALNETTDINADGYNFTQNTNLPEGGTHTAFTDFCNNQTHACLINDHCETATNILINSTAIGTNDSATASSFDTDNQDCFQDDHYNGGDIWFEFTTPSCSSGTVDVEIGVIATDFSHTHVVLYDACDGNNIINCGRSNTSGTGPFELEMISGLDCHSTYKILVYDRHNNDIGNIEMYVNCVTNCDGLPLKLTTFSGKSLAYANQLQWTTATEQDLAYFQIERSVNGQTDWQILNKIDAKGDSNTSQSYETLDKQPLQKAFYRLQSVEQSGKTEFSETIFMEREGHELDWIILPNPATDAFEIQVQVEKKTDVRIAVMDVLGRTIWEKQSILATGKNQFSLDINNWNRGICFVTVEMGGQLQVRKVVLH